MNFKEILMTAVAVLIALVVYDLAVKKLVTKNLEDAETIDVD